jgi:hypothetical protein
MEKKKIDKVIEAFRNYRNIKEEIANVVGSGETSLGYKLETESPPVKKKRENKKYIFQKGLRKWWTQNTK